MPSVEWSAVPRTKEGRLWGPDLFAWAYDELDRSQLWRNQETPENLEHEKRVIRWRDLIRDGAGWISDEVFDQIHTDISGTSKPAATLLELVVAIDRAYHGLRLVDTGVASAPAFLSDVLRCWERKRSLERAAAGRVLRKGACWRAGSALSHYCNEMSRVPAEISDRVVMAPATALIGPTVGDLIREPPGDVTITVAFVPTLEEAEHLGFSPVDRGKGRYFAVEPGTDRQAELRDTVDDLVRELESAGVNIALLPETAMDDATVEEFQKALRANNLRKIRDGEWPSLRMAIVGRVGPRENEAVILGSDGGSVLGHAGGRPVAQPKNNRWRIDGPQLEKYGLTAALGEQDRDEDIHEGSTLSFVDDPGFGRIGILICEDLARGDTAYRLTTAATPTVVISPICDASLVKGRWAYIAAKRLVDEPGALVLVTNSLTLADREHRRKDPTGPPLADAGVGIVMHPSPDYPNDVVSGQPGAPGFVTRTIGWPEVWERP